MKVGKNNFRPPPQVESSVVRIEPKLGKDRPNVSWDEWDGLLRVCFVRKNKTLRASWLGTKEILAMVERNYRTWCAMNGVPIDESIVEGAAEDEEDMDIDDGANDGEDAGMEVDDLGGDDTPSFFQDLKNANANIPKTKSKRKKTKVAELVREKIRKVLEDVTELADKRSGKCDENDFLRLLFAFNEEGIHFS
jgi:18S rRNA (adenine1779-N6/adenine1780-N6)-dimethyltransferase